MQKAIGVLEQDTVQAARPRNQAGALIRPVAAGLERDELAGANRPVATLGRSADIQVREAASLQGPHVGPYGTEGDGRQAIHRIPTINGHVVINDDIVCAIRPGECNGLDRGRGYGIAGRQR